MDNTKCRFRHSQNIGWRGFVCFCPDKKTLCPHRDDYSAGRCPALFTNFSDYVTHVISHLHSEKSN